MHHICSMHPSTHTSKHVGWHCTEYQELQQRQASGWNPALLYLPQTLSPSNPLRFIRKETKSLPFQIHFGLWTCQSHWETVLCSSVFPATTMLILFHCWFVIFYFSCKKKKKKCFAFYPVRVPVLLLAFTFSLYCIVTPFCKMVLIADWAPVFWLLCTLITCFFICSTAGAKTWCPCIPQTLASWRQIGSV